jgi:chromosome segregation ATPase
MVDASTNRLTHREKELEEEILQLRAMNESQKVNIQQLQTQIAVMSEQVCKAADELADAYRACNNIEIAFREVLKQIARGLAWKE